MEQVQTSLETSDKTSPLADIVGDWIRAVELLVEENEKPDPEAEEVVKAIEGAVSSAKGMQPLDHRS